MRLRLLLWVPLVSAFLLLRATHAGAQAPTCPGADTEGAARALSEGDRASDRAAAAVRRHRSEDAAREWAAALAAYDRACADGADEALERRAIPLFRLGRVVDAAVSLDSFLAIHAMDSLPAEVARRVAANLSVIERSVATLHLTTTPSTAEIRVDGVPRGVGPGLRVRVAVQSPVTLEVVAGGYESQRATITYEPGEHDVAVALRPVLSLAPAAPILPAASGSETTPEGPAPARSDPPASGPWLLVGGIVTAALSVVSALLATALVLESEGRGNIMLLRNTTDAGLLGGGLFVGSAVFGLASVALFVAHALEGSSSHRAWLCGPSGLGGGCVGRF